MGLLDYMRSQMDQRFAKPTPLLAQPQMDAGQQLRYQLARQAQEAQSQKAFLSGLLGMAPVVGDAMGVHDAVTRPRTTYKQMAKTETGKTIGGLLDKADMGMRGMALAAPGLLGLGALHAMAGPKQNLSPLAKMYGNQMGAIVYHGTPHKFAPEPDAPLGKFKLEKIGTGEGAQAYGHGLYVAEARPVAEGYRDTLSGQANPYSVRANNIDSAWVSTAKEMHKAGYSESDIRGTLKSAYKNISDEQVDLSMEMANPGSLYTVDLPDEHIANMLDWDKPLSEQPESVRKAIKESGLNSPMDRSGQSLYMDVGLKHGRDVPSKEFYRVAAEKLNSLGVPGIKYLDQGSRGKGDGTRNYVVFNPELLKILKRE